MKRCSDCQQIRPHADFNKNKSAPDGLQWRCRDCQKIAMRKGYQSHRGEILAKKKELRDTKPEELRKRDREYYQRNIEKICKRQREHYEDKPEVSKARRAVQMAVDKGELGKPETFYCIRCFSPAVHYHHQSYRKDDWLNVISLCGSCHMLIHAREEERQALRLGVVPTPTGLVRIAIATPP